IQLSNIVLTDLRQLTCLGRLELFAASFHFRLKDQAKAYSPQPIQPNVRRQATFMNRDTDPVVALTPNIEQGIFYPEGLLDWIPPTAPDANLVELTGIEPVASWLQTRRSPS